MTQVFWLRKWTSLMCRFKDISWKSRKWNVLIWKGLKKSQRIIFGLNYIENYHWFLPPCILCNCLWILHQDDKILNFVLNTSSFKILYICRFVEDLFVLLLMIHLTNRLALKTSFTFVTIGTLFPRVSLLLAGRFGGAGQPAHVSHAGMVGDILHWGQVLRFGFFQSTLNKRIKAFKHEDNQRIANNLNKCKIQVTTFDVKRIAAHP